jgi:hypothetical protein
MIFYRKLLKLQRAFGALKIQGLQLISWEGIGFAINWLPVRSHQMSIEDLEELFVSQMLIIDNMFSALLSIDVLCENK